MHKELPEGGILIFVTGQQEVNSTVKKLRKIFPARSENELESEEDEDLDEVMEKASKQMMRKRRKKKGAKTKAERLAEKDKLLVPKVNLDDFSAVPLDDTENDANVEVADSDEDDEEEQGGDELVQGLKVGKHVIRIFLPECLVQHKIFECKRTT